MELNITRIDTGTDDASQALARLRQQLSPRGEIVSEAGRQRTIEVFGEPLTSQQVVERICSDVASRGVSAVLEYSRKLDHAELDAASIRVSVDQMQRAHRGADEQFLATIRRIRDNIHEFQTAILHQDVELNRPSGIRLRQRYVPLRRVGICVPGGAAAYPSTVLMTAVPAQAAGVDQLVVVAPPTQFGANNPDVLATCYELGVEEVYRVGGAQAVAALAYGIEVMPQVDKIVGPGNLFVALAKKHVFGHVDIDSIAGPSEVVVIADETSRPEFVAADLLAQAEHAPGASILISWDAGIIQQTYEQLERQLAGLSRAELTRQSLESFGAFILVQDEVQACEITDLIAPEHLHIETAHPEQTLNQIRNAGATFLGDYTPVALGDYVAGPSHVLPTGGTARWASGLTANDFLRSGSVISYTEEALRTMAQDVQLMADKEGLTAHRCSVDIRVDGKQPS